MREGYHFTLLRELKVTVSILKSINTIFTRSHTLDNKMTSLALHGVIALKSGEVINVKIGESDKDPVFYITDLLPHLAHESEGQPLNKVFLAENLNILIGGIPVSGEDKDAVKMNVLKILNERYGVTEHRLMNALNVIVSTVVNGAAPKDNGGDDE